MGHPVIVSGVAGVRGGARATARHTASRELSPQAVAQLTVSGHQPCISVLMPTSPGPRLALADRELLDDLLLDVERRLADDRVTDRERLVRELRRLGRIARDSSTSHALGLFVNRDVSRAWTLPVAVHPKVVVESTFATRDLLRALHRTPPHLVVRVDRFGARVFWVGTRVTLLETVERLPARNPRHVGPWSTENPEADDCGDLLARIDACLTRVRAQRPAPLVLAGDPGLVTDLRAAAGSLHRLAGEVVDARAEDPGELFRASALCLADYLHRRGQASIHALQEAAASAPDHVVAGMDACWAAVAARVPGTLIVEQGYVHPRPPGDGGEAGSHDLVDDLLELALEAGNLIAFADDAELHEFGGIALLRSG